MERIKLIDQDGHIVCMTKEDIAESLRVMGNPGGLYGLFSGDDKCLANGDVTFLEVDSVSGRQRVVRPVLQFRSYKLPNYSWWQKKIKEWRWYLGQRTAKRQFDAVNTKGLIWESTPFVLKMPWLLLKGKKAVTIEVK